MSSRSQHSYKGQTAYPSDTPVKMVHRGLHWACLGGIQSHVLTQSGPVWENPDSDERFVLVKSNALRSVYRLTYDQAEYYVKYYYYKGVKGRLKRRLRGHYAETEFQQLVLARRRQVAVAKPWAWAHGSFNGRPGSLLLTESLGRTEMLEDLLWQKPPISLEKRQQVLDITMDIIAQMHCAGLEHRDLHTGNIVIGWEPQCQGWVMDLQAMRVRETRQGHASANPWRPWRMQNLAVLTASLRQTVSRNEINALVKRYLQAVQGGLSLSEDDIANYCQQLTHYADRHDRAIKRKRQRRCLRDSRYASRITLPGHWRGMVYCQWRHELSDYQASKMRLTAEQWRQTLGNMDTMLGQGKVLKQGRGGKTVVGRLEFPDGSLPVVIKHIVPKHNWRGWLQRIRPSRARRQWQRGHLLLDRELPTAWPLAMLVRRRWGILLESIYITELIEDAENLKTVFLNGRWKDYSAQDRRAVSCNLGQLIAKLENLEIRHRDCKVSNLLIKKDLQGNWKNYLVDLDGVYEKRNYYAWIARHESVIRLGASCLEHPAVGARDMAVFLRAYCDGLEGDVSKHKLMRYLRKEVPRRRAETLAKNARREPLSNQYYRNILIVKPSSLGDVVRCLGVYQRLREKMPHSRISWLVRPEFEPIVAHASGINGIIRFARKDIGRFWTLSGFTALIRLLGELKQGQYDLVLDMQGLFRSGLFSYCTGAPVRVGFGNAREGARYFYTHRITLPTEPEHIVESYWRFAELLGLGQMPAIHGYPLDDDIIDGAKKCLAEHGWQDGQAYALLMIGGTAASKRWPAERFAKLAELLEKSYDMVSVLVGTGDAEAAAGKAIVESGLGRVINLVGRTSLMELTGIIAGASVVIGNDSGPLHIAATWGVSTIGLYGPTDARVVGPYGQDDGVIQCRSEDTSAVGERYSRDPAHQMTTISVADVWAVVEKKLSGSVEARDMTV